MEKHERKLHGRDWLDAEQHGRDDVAELAFARLVAELPPIEPSPDFVSRAVHTAWRARARRRLISRLARVAAGVLIAAASLALTYAVGIFIAGALVRSTVMSAHGLVWLMTTVGEGVRWWCIAERLGSAAGETIAAPQTTMVMAVIELVGAMAIYAFQRVLRDDGSTDSEKART